MEWVRISVFAYTGILYGHKNSCSTAMYNIAESSEDKVGKRDQIYKIPFI